MRQRNSNRQSGTRYLLGLLALLALSIFAAGAYAQGGNVTITGTVTDSTGAVLPSAKVTATQKNTSITRVDTTNGTGQFNVSSIPPGTYTVTVEAPGFKKYVQDVVLLADQIRDLDVHLQVGEQTQQVTDHGVRARGEGPGNLGSERHHCE